MKEMCIYRIVCLVTGQEYVGSTTSFRHRRWTHLHYLRYNKHKSHKLQEAWNEFGMNNFKFEIIETISDKSILKIREQYWMDISNSLFNSAPRSDSLKGVTHTNKSRNNMRVAHLGIIPSAEATAKAVAKRKGRKRPLSAILKTQKPVLQFSENGILIKEWPSVKSAAQEFKVNYTNIVNCCRGRKKRIRGFNWKYKNEQMLQGH